MLELSSDNSATSLGAVAALCLGTLAVALGATIVAVASPKITRGFAVAPTAL